MAIVKYKNQTGGMTPDLSPHKQDPSQCSFLLNYRQWKGAVSKIGGQKVMFDNMPLLNPTLVDFWSNAFTPAGPSTGFYITAKQGQVFSTDEYGVSTDITQSGTPYSNIFTGAPIKLSTYWMSTQMFGGLTYIATNEEVEPQFITNDPTISPTGQLQTIPGWIWNDPLDPDPYVAQSAKRIVSFDNQLFAGYIVKKRASGKMEYYPNLILYSDKATNPANTYQNYIPDVWQPSSGTATQAANWAGYTSLNTTDAIVDFLPLRDVLLCFTTNRTYAIPKLAYPQAPLSPQIISTTRGLLALDCAITFEGLVLMVTTDDIVLTSAASIDFKSIANSRIKDYFFRARLTQNPDWQTNTWADYNRYYNEVWIMYPSRDSVDGRADEALIYDVETGAWSQTELPGIYDDVYSPILGVSGDPWTGYNFSYSRIVYQWGYKLLAQDIGRLRQWSTGNTIPTIFEKVYDFEDQKTDATVIKKLASIFPFFTGNTTLQFELKFSNIPFVGSVDWTTPDYSGDFTTIEDYKIDPYRAGRFMALRILSDNTANHDIVGIDLDVDIDGKRG